MAGPYTKFQLLFQVTTDPTNQGDARSHTGGWSEQHVWPGVIAIDGPQINNLATRRAALLPTQAAIVGVRRSIFTTSGNKMQSQGSQTAGLARVGGPAITDLPQVSLTVDVTGEAGGNSAKQNLRCIPDTFMQRGEFQPTAAYKTLLANYNRCLIDENWAFMGRNLANPTTEVLDITGDKITLAFPGLVAVGDYIRLLQVKDASTGLPISGAFRVTVVDGAKNTVVGLPQGAVALNSGYARKDEIVLVNIGSASWGRAVVRKIGRPLEGYRGRASKRR